VGDCLVGGLGHERGLKVVCVPGPVEYFAEAAESSTWRRLRGSEASAVSGGKELVELVEHPLRD